MRLSSWEIWFYEGDGVAYEVGRPVQIVEISEVGRGIRRLGGSKNREADRGKALKVFVAFVLCT